MTKESRTAIAQRKRQHRDSKFKPEWLLNPEQLPPATQKDVSQFPTASGFLSPNEILITESTAPEILEKIKSREWSAYEVTSAFAHRASIAHQLVNCLSEVFFDEGLEMAKELDEYYATTGELRGPLHGLPISLKDNLNIRGHATSLGFVGFAFNPLKMESESALVVMLRSMGAVFYCKTNVPTAMMMGETNNHLYGETTNPLNRDHTSGGSSGGESALLALKGSPLGVGSDIGGSIRIPSALCNLFGLRPSFGRLPTYGTRSGLPGFESVNSVGGPMSTSLEGMALYTKAVIDTEPWNFDPKVVPMAWRDIELPETLNFAILKDDGVVKPYPAVQRGLDLVEDKLRALGHDIIEWDPTDHKELGDIVTQFFLSDGGVHVKEYAALTGEPLFPSMKMYDDASDIPVSQLWDLQSKRTGLAKAYLDRWNETAKKTKNGKVIDAILMPATPYSGCARGKLRYVGYTSVFNCVDYTAGIVPVTVSTKEDVMLGDGWAPRNDLEKEHFDMFDPEELVGGAVSVQIVGRKLEEEKVLGMMCVVSNAVGTKRYWSK